MYVVWRASAKKNYSCNQQKWSILGFSDCVKLSHIKWNAIREGLDACKDDEKAEADRDSFYGETWVWMGWDEKKHF